MSDLVSEDFVNRYQPTEDDPFVLTTKGGTFGGPNDSEDDGRFYYGGGSVLDDGSVNPEHYAALPKEMYDQGLVHPGQVFGIRNPKNGERALVVARDIGPSAPHRGVDIAPHVAKAIDYETDAPLEVDLRPHGMAPHADLAARGYKPVMYPHPNFVRDPNQHFLPDLPRTTGITGQMTPIGSNEEPFTADDGSAATTAQLDAQPSPIVLDDEEDRAAAQDQNESELATSANLPTAKGIQTLWNPDAEPADVKERLSDGSVVMTNGVHVYPDHIERDIGGKRYAEYIGQHPVNVVPNSGLQREALKRGISYYDSAGKMRSDADVTKLVTDFDKGANSIGDIETFKKEHPDDYAKAKALAEYRLPVSSYGLTRSPVMQKMIGAALAINPNFDATQYDAHKNVRRQFSSTTPTTAGGQIIAVNTALRHLEVLDRAADALDNKALIDANTLTNYVAKHAGRPEVVAFNSARNMVANELARAFRGGVPTNLDLDEWNKALNSSSSPDQIHAVIKGTIPELLSGRLGELSDFYEQSIGSKPDHPFLHPRSAEALRKMKVDPAIYKDFTGSAANDEAPSAITTPQPAASPAAVPPPKPDPQIAAQAIKDAQEILARDPNDAKAKQVVDTARTLGLIK